MLFAPRGLRNSGALAWRLALVPSQISIAMARTSNTCSIELVFPSVPMPLFAIGQTKDESRMSQFGKVDS
jgi:hypothetical protein